MISWIKCNIFNKHLWSDMGYQNLYGERYYRCPHCNRIKRKENNPEKVRKFKETLYKSFGKAMKEGNE